MNWTGGRAIGDETARAGKKNAAEDVDDLRRFIRQVRGSVDSGYQQRPPWTPSSCDYWTTAHSVASQFLTWISYKGFFVQLQPQLAQSPVSHR